MTDKKRLGNKNAEKPPEQRRQSITIRLPKELIEELKKRGNVTAQIEQAINLLFNRV